MKKEIEVFDYAAEIMKAVKKRSFGNHKGRG